LLTVCFVGVAVLGAAFAEELGVSDAIGAFMMGVLLGGSKVALRIRKLVLPLRDAFGALFFFIFGLSIDPRAVGPVLVPVLIAVVLTIVLNLVAGAVTAKLHSFDRQAGINIGLTVLTRGEFSLVLAAMATTAGLDARIGPFVAGYVLLLAIIGPLARAPLRPARPSAAGQAVPVAPASSPRREPISPTSARDGHAVHSVALDLEGEPRRAVEPFAAHLNPKCDRIARLRHDDVAEAHPRADELRVAPRPDRVVAAELPAPVVDHTVGVERGDERFGVPGFDGVEDPPHGGGDVAHAVHCAPCEGRGSNVLGLYPAVGPADPGSPG
jgi:hypothetical protein